MRSFPAPSPCSCRVWSAAKAKLSALFKSRNRPDALFTANNSSTIWVIEALQEMNIQIDKDVALVGFDDVGFYTLITPPITAVRQPAAELGRMSVRLLLQRINGEFLAPASELSSRIVVIRESCGCKRKE